MLCLSRGRALFAMMLFILFYCETNSNPAFAAQDGAQDAWVIARSSDETIQITALGLIHRIRLEVYDQKARMIYDSQFLSGSSIGWNFLEAGQLDSGNYGYSVTFEDLAGNFSSRSGFFQYKDKKVAFFRGNLDEDQNWNLLQLQDLSPIVLVAHDGNNGLITSGKGGLSFQTANSSSGVAADRMFLSAEGDLGIGVQTPQAKLDVAGLIRTSEGIMFPDGTIQKTALSIGAIGIPMASEKSPNFLIYKNDSSGVRPLALESATATFYGQNAGAANTGESNAFFGASSGQVNTTGTHNSFFGQESGNANTVGTDNAFFGYRAGYHNISTEANSFFGSGAGYNNAGRYNSFFGMGAGLYNVTGESNSFFGFGAGQSNTAETANTFLGSMSDGAAGITNATAIGAFSQVTESNALVLGSISGINSANEDTYVGIGTTNPDRQLVVEGEQALIRFTRYYSDAIHAPALLMEHSRGTRSAPADMVPGDYLGKVQFRGRVSGNMPEYGVFAFVASDLNQNGRFSFIDRDLTTERVSILNTGNMGIGTTTPTERLHVVGNIKVTGNVLAGASENIPDYVFEPDYKLMSLKQLGSFITQEKHLPNIPSALEMKDKDVNLNEFQMKLLEKIEELTLYVVQQSKEIESQTKIIKTKDAEITNLKSKSSDLDSRLSELEQLLKK